MTTNTNPAVVTYTEDGATVERAIAFKFRANSDLIVTRISAGVETLLVLDIDYTLTGAGNDEGGTLLAAEPAAAGVKLKIKRRTARLQGMDYTPHDTFPAESHEDALDKLSLVDQEIDADLLDIAGRALLAAPGEVGGSLPLRSARGNKYAAYDVAGDPVALSGDPSDAVTLTDLGDPAIGARLVALADGSSVHGLFKGTELEVYVDPAGDDDTGAGTLANPYRTIQKAFDSLPRLLELQATIWLKPGTHNENYLFGSTDLALYPRNAVLFARGRSLLTRTQNNAGSMSGAVVIRPTGAKGTAIIETSADLDYGIYVEACQVALQDVVIRAGAAGTQGLAVAHRGGAYLHTYDCDFDGNGNDPAYGIYAEAGGLAEITGLSSAIDDCVVGIGVFHGSLVDLVSGSAISNCTIACSVVLGELSIQADVAGITAIAASNTKGIYCETGRVDLRGASDGVPVRIASTIELVNTPLTATFALLSGVISVNGGSVYLNNSDWSSQLTAYNAGVHLRDSNSFIAPAVKSTQANPLYLLGGAHVTREGTSIVIGSADGPPQFQVTTMVPAGNGDELRPELGVERMVLTGNGSAFTGCTLAAVDAGGKPAAIVGQLLHVIGATAVGSSVELVTSATLILPASITIGGDAGDYSGATFMFTGGSWKLVALGAVWP